MASTKEKMQRARQLIKEKKYDEARSILRTVDHDKAYEWLDKLDKIAPVAFSAVEKSKVKKKPGIIRRTLKWSGIAIGFLCGCTIIAAMFGDGEGVTDPTKIAPTAVVQSESTVTDTDVSDEPVDSNATAFAQATIDNINALASEAVLSITETANAPTVTLTPTNTSSPTPLPTNTPRPTNTPFPTSTPRPANTEDPNQADANLIQSGFAFAASEIDLVSVQIADGRANGGERSVIIAYQSTAVSESDLLTEWGLIFGVVGGVVREYNTDLDAILIVVGDAAGNTIGSVAAQVSDVTLLLNGQITEVEFLNRISVDNF